MTTPRIPTHSPRTASRVYSGEAVIISPIENMVRMLNATGSRIWELVDGVRTVEEIAQLLVAEYEIDPDQARRATTDFLAELTARELITWR